jgi:protein TonB
MTDEGWLVPAALAVSLAGHLVAVDVLAARASARQLVKPPIAVRFRVVDRARPAAAPSPKAPEPPKPAEKKAPAARPVRTHEQPAVEASPASIETTGVTLTGEGASWSSVIGNGQASNAPLRVAPAPQIEKRARALNPEPRSRLPEALPAASLSRRPVPPALDDALRKHYPAAARRRGLEGEAVVRVRIDADGRVRIASVVSETAAGFGEACRSTVVGSVWTAPLDRSGAPVATHARYRCHFHVDD